MPVTDCTELAKAPSRSNRQPQRLLLKMFLINIFLINMV